MPFDSFTLTAVKNELKKTLIDARLEKIYMPSSSLLLFNFHTKTGRQKLLIALDNYARLHLTDQSFENPLNAPAFCMHLRKYLGGARLKSITQPPYERILEFNFSVLNELRDTVNFKVIAEIMGKYSNVIAVNDKGIITDCVKHIHPDLKTDNLEHKRILLPNVVYAYPQTPDKITIDDRERFLDRLDQFDGGALDNYIMGFLKGIAPSTAYWLVKDINVFDNEFDQKTKEIVYNQFFEYAQKIKNNQISPVVTYKDGAPDDYYLMPMDLGLKMKSFDSINRAIDYCMSHKTNISAFKVKYNEFFQTLKSLKTKAEKKRFIAENKLRESAKADQYKLYGELILSNLHLLKNKTDKAQLFNYYDNAYVTVPLDIQLNAQANAQKYFKRYNKEKRSAEIARIQIEEQNEFCDYLDTILESLRQCQDLADLKEIGLELRQSSLIKDTAKKPKAVLSKYREYNIDGFLVRVGKNNLQNDRLARQSKPEDVWLHAKDIHSSHTVIVSDKQDIPDKVLICAAEITAYYSKAHMSQNVPVDYTLIKYVKKPPKSPLGKVTYSHQKTLFV
ncbi:MAG TPA: fibronectin/fibrinogen-binding protein, partial [Clostridiales bacterium]|nr:fibronectin/fibrinogen-binding protein [Clostridiales bacterium]